MTCLDRPEIMTISSGSVVMAWLESHKLDKPSLIDAKPSCHNSFGFAVAWLWPKMALSGFKWL